MEPTVIDVESGVHESETYALSMRIVERVAEAEGVEPTDLTPLFSVVDPDALDALFQSRRWDASSASETVRFPYHGYEVRVDADGTVTLTERTPD